MASYYVNSAAAGANTGGSWTDAFLTFAQGLAAATTAGDSIYVASVHSESLGADAAYVFGANNLKVICCTAGTTTPATGALIGAQATTYGITLYSVTKKIYVYGVTFRIPGTANKAFNIPEYTSDTSQFEFESCRFEYLTTGGASFTIGPYFSSVGNFQTHFKDCVFKFGAAGHWLIVGKGRVYFQNCSVDAAGTAPTTFIKGSVDANAYWTFEGCDLSKVTGTLVGDINVAYLTAAFINCKLGTSVTPRATNTILNLGGGEVSLYNCASGDTHYSLAHYNSLGQTTVTTAIYVTADGAAYDGTNRCSWVITSTANATYYCPYVSPWFDRYNSATSAVTPRIEILRDGSATAYNDNEVWGEWSYQGTSGSPLSILVDDRMTLLGTPAAQATSALAAGQWTGEGGTAWFGKLEPASAITPAEIGHYRARVCVGVASATVYADPTIRGV